MSNNDQAANYNTSPPAEWGQSPHIYPHSHHGTPAQEYTGFGFQPHTTFGGSIQQRPVQQQLQPLIMPQWPSMLNSQAQPQPQSQHQQPANYQLPYPPSVQPIQPMPPGPMHTPLSAPVSARSAPTPRKTLTDSDRRRMCKYAEDNPQAKQTEIGGEWLCSACSDPMCTDTLFQRFLE